MSTKNTASTAYLLIAIIVAFALLVPFFIFGTQLTAIVVLVFFSGIIMLIDPFKGLLVILLFRPLLDFFTADTLFSFGPIAVNVAALLAIIPITIGSIITAGKLEKIKKVPLFGQWILFLLVAIFSVLFTVDLSSSMAEIMRLLTFFALYLTAFFSIRTAKRTEGLANLLIASSAVPAAVAVIQYFKGTGLSISFQDVPNRLLGTFAHPNLFAFYLVLVVGLLLYKFLRYKKNDNKFFWLSLIAILCVLLIETYTRGAWIALMLVVLIMGTLQYRKMLVMGIGIFLGAYLLLAPIQDRLNESLSPGNSSSVQWRFEMWRDATGYALEEPWKGHGAGTAETVIESRRGKKNESSAIHNDYLKIALEYGLVGFAGYLLLHLSLINKTFQILKNLRPTTKSRTLVLAFGSLLIAFAVASLSDNILDTTALQWALWSLAGAVMGTYYPQKSK